MRGISTSSVMTSGLCRTKSSRAAKAAEALPTTSTKESLSSNFVMRVRVTAESSTTRT